MFSFALWKALTHSIAIEKQAKFDTFLQTCILCVMASYLFWLVKNTPKSNALRIFFFGYFSIIYIGWGGLPLSSPLYFLYSYATSLWMLFNYVSMGYFVFKGVKYFSGMENFYKIHFIILFFGCIIQDMHFYGNYSRPPSMPLVRYCNTQMNYFFNFFTILNAYGSLFLLDVVALVVLARN